MRKLVLFFMVVVCVGMMGCAAGLSNDYAVLDAHPAIQADESHATIVFMRKSNFAGGAYGYYVWENGEKVCALESGTYCIHSAEAGEHLFYTETFGGWTPTTKRSEFKISVETGKIYYAESSIAFKNRPSFDILPEQDAMQIIVNLKNTQMNKVLQ